MLLFDELKHIAHGLNEILMARSICCTQRGLVWFFANNAGQSSKEIDCDGGDARERNRLEV